MVKNIMNRGSARLLLLAALVAGGDIALAQAQTQKITGDIVRVDGLRLEVKTAGGQAVTVKLADNFRLSVRSAADVSKLPPGTYVGTTAVPQPDGTLAAERLTVGKNGFVPPPL